MGHLRWDYYGRQLLAAVSIAGKNCSLYSKAHAMMKVVLELHVRFIRFIRGGS